MGRTIFPRCSPDAGACWSPAVLHVWRGHHHHEPLGAAILSSWPRHLLQQPLHKPLNHLPLRPRLKAHNNPCLDRDRPEKLLPHHIPHACPAVHHHLPLLVVPTTSSCVAQQGIRGHLLQWHPNFQQDPTQVFQVLYTTDENIFISALTGSGKTICAEQPRAVCIEPYQEMVDQCMAEWRGESLRDYRAAGQEEDCELDRRDEYGLEVTGEG